MTEPTAFPPGAFDKADPSADPLFYAEPRFVAHIDDGAIAAVTEIAIPCRRAASSSI